MLYRLFISPIYVIFQEKILNHKKASRQLLSYLFLKPLPLLCLIISHFGQSDYEKPDNRGTSTAKKPLPKAPENGKFLFYVWLNDHHFLLDHVHLLYIYCSNNSI